MLQEVGHEAEKIQAHGEVHPSSSFLAVNQKILRALKKYGMIVADNGSDWFIFGAPDSRWDDGDLHNLHRLHGRNFEVVYTGAIEH